MKNIRIHQVDAFTSTPFAGNPAGVILEADGLSEDEMQQIANELGNPESAFFFRPEDDSHDLRVRYFSPQQEVPLCGHATIAAHYVRAKILGLPSGVVRMKTHIGVLPIEIRKQNDGDYIIVMTQGEPVITRTLDRSESASLFSALGIGRADVEDLPIQVVSTGNSMVMIPLRRRDQLQALHPDFNQLRRLSRLFEASGFHVFTFDNAYPDALAHARMFPPATGVNEDPVTGMANGALGAYLVNNRIVQHDGAAYAFRVVQGEAMLRPGRIDVEVDIRQGRAAQVRVSGRAVVVFSAELDRALFTSTQPEVSTLVS